MYAFEECETSSDLDTETVATVSTELIDEELFYGDLEAKYKDLNGYVDELQQSIDKQTEINSDIFTKELDGKKGVNVLWWLCFSRSEVLLVLPEDYLADIPLDVWCSKPLEEEAKDISALWWFCFKRIYRDLLSNMLKKGWLSTLSPSEWMTVPLEILVSGKTLLCLFCDSSNLLKSLYDFNLKRTVPPEAWAVLSKEDGTTPFWWHCYYEVGRILIGTFSSEWMLDMPAEAWESAPKEGDFKDLNALFWFSQPIQAKNSKKRIILGKLNDALIAKIPAKAWVQTPTQGRFAGCCALINFLEQNGYFLISKKFPEIFKILIGSEEYWKTIFFQGNFLLYHLCKTPLFLSEYVLKHMTFFFQPFMLTAWTGLVEFGGIVGSAFAFLCANEQGGLVLRDLWKMIDSSVKDEEARNRLSMKFIEDNFLVQFKDDHQRYNKLLYQLACSIQGVCLLKSWCIEGIMSVSKIPFNQTDKTTLLSTLDILKAVLWNDEVEDEKIHASCHYYYGLIAYNAVAGVRNFEIAFEQFQLAKEYGHEQAGYLLNLLKQRGHGTKKIVELKDHVINSSLPEGVKSRLAKNYVFFYWCGSTLPSEGWFGLRRWCIALKETAFLPILFCSDQVLDYLKKHRNLSVVENLETLPFMKYKNETIKDCYEDFGPDGFGYCSVTDGPLKRYFFVISLDCYWDKLSVSYFKKNENPSNEEVRAVFQKIKSAWRQANQSGLYAHVKNHVIYFIICYHGGFYFDIDQIPEGQFPYFSMTDCLSIIQQQGDLACVLEAVTSKSFIYCEMRQQFNCDGTINWNAVMYEKDVGFYFNPIRAFYYYKNDISKSQVEENTEIPSDAMAAKLKQYHDSTTDVKQVLSNAFDVGVLQAYGKNPCDFMAKLYFEAIAHPLSQQFFLPDFDMAWVELVKLFEKFHFRYFFASYRNPQHINFYCQYLSHFIKPTYCLGPSSVLHTGYQRLASLEQAAVTIQKQVRAGFFKKQNALNHVDNTSENKIMKPCRV